jgi:hypothetical protein
MGGVAGKDDAADDKARGLSPMNSEHGAPLRRRRGIAKEFAYARAMCGRCERIFVADLVRKRSDDAPRPFGKSHRHAQSRQIQTRAHVFA